MPRSDNLELHDGVSENLAPRVFVVDLSQFAKQLAHALVFRPRHDNLHFDDLVASLPRTPSRWSALFAQTKFLAAVRSRRNAHLRAAVDRRYFHFRPEGRFGHRNGNHSV